MGKIDGTVVLDTNVFVKMFFDEDDSAKAEILLQRFNERSLIIAIPAFVVYEFVNVLWLRVRRAEVTPNEAVEVLKRFMAMSLDMLIEPVHELAFHILGYCLSCDHAAYDMAFLVLAEQLNAPFITADQQLYLKALSQSQLPVLLRNID